MNLIKLLPAVAFALAPALACAPSPAYAAHAGAPYTNVDHSNAGQLNENYNGPLQLRTPSTDPGPGVPTGPAPLSPPTSR